MRRKRYLSPEERMQISLRRHEVEATGKPFYTKYADIPEGFVFKSQAKRMGKPVQEGEEPVAYVLVRRMNGYMPLYDRIETEKRHKKSDS